MTKGSDFPPASGGAGASIAPITDAEANAALDRATAQVALNLGRYAGRCQNHSSVGGIYPPCGNDQWTTGFWPGEIWLAWERTGDVAFRTAGEAYVESFYDRITRKVSVDHHDMGFLYTPCCVAPWKLSGDKRAREAAILAARQLLTRFQEAGGFFQAWGPMGERANYRFIIDCLMNLPLLYWASAETGDQGFAEKADLHAATCLAHSFRSDFSTFHTFFMDPENGEGVRGETCQGFRADSSWARGQAWAVYGLALTYRRTGKDSVLDLFKGVASYYLSRLPADLVPYWDLVFTADAVDGKGSYEPSASSEPRDSSSAAIVACGLLEMAEALDAKGAGSLSGGTARDAADLGADCRLIARRMVASLARGYVAGEPAPGKGLLLHGTYSKKSPYNTCTEEGVDESLAWGDYFYMEALTRLTKKWAPYW